MTRRPTDARLSAARYALGQPPASADEEEQGADAGRPTADQRAQYVEIQIQQAMRRGDFDGLPGAGKPLVDVDAVRDPDWWIRRKIEREGLTGLGPPALTLRTEDAALDDRLDALPTEARVRELLDDFNARVKEARRQLLGGPPVVTRPRDVETEVVAWRARASARAAEREAERAAAEAERAARIAALPWWQRGRARRAR